MFWKIAWQDLSLIGETVFNGVVHNRYDYSFTIIKMANKYLAFDKNNVKIAESNRLSYVKRRCQNKVNEENKPVPDNNAYYYIELTKPQCNYGAGTQFKMLENWAAQKSYAKYYGWLPALIKEGVIDLPIKIKPKNYKRITFADFINRKIKCTSN